MGGVAGKAVFQCPRPWHDFPLQSIYPDYISSDHSEEVARLDIPVDLGVSRPLEVVDDGTAATSSRSNKDATSISALPPLSLHFIFTPAYPLHAPPTIVSLESMGDWLSCVEALKGLLLDLWQPGESVLYDWVELIRTGDFLQSLGLTSGDSIRYVVNNRIWIQLSFICR
jgi:E3 ubiquitin-protein ligase RNF14